MRIFPRGPARTRRGTHLACLLALAATLSGAWTTAAPAVFDPAGQTPIGQAVEAPAPRAPAAALPSDARRDLRSDERLGGHTLARHIGRTDAELAARLQ